jgi:2-keto-4-pentenoate hydratase/2-oxohepta-3-ene-1,7-dioic acid hydratase in catechol pathway
MRIVRIATDLPASDPLASFAYAELEGDRAWLLGKAPWLGGARTGAHVAFDEARLGVPCEPTKVVGIGRNYRAHAKELGNEVPTEPLFFLKPPSGLLAHGGTIVRPSSSQRVEHEAELAVVIGRRARRVPIESAHEFVFGYTICNDVTARDIQRREVQFTRAKGFDSFCPLGPVIVTDLDPRDVGVRAKVNGELRQNGRTRDMIFDVATLISFVSAVMTLEPGDVISTGTPEGVGPLVAGDVVEIEVDGIGTLRSHVADEAR